MYSSYQTLLREVYKKGRYQVIREESTKELIDVSLKIDVNHNFFYYDKLRTEETIRDYLLGELVWYFSGRRDVKFISEYSVFWNKLVDGSGNVNSNYGRLVFYKKKFSLFRKTTTMFEWCLRQLENNPMSRQAIILYNDKDYFYNNNKDFICTQSQHFFIRDDKLSSVVYMRSSDLILGLTYDISWWSIVLQYLYLYLRKSYYEKNKRTLGIGNVVVHVGSAHVYLNKDSLIKRILKQKIRYRYLELTNIIPLHKSIEWYKENINDYIRFN